MKTFHRYLFEIFVERFLIWRGLYFIWYPHLSEKLGKLNFVFSHTCLQTYDTTRFRASLRPLSPHYSLYQLGDFGKWFTYTFTSPREISLKSVPRLMFPKFSEITDQSIFLRIMITVYFSSAFGNFSDKFTAPVLISLNGCLRGS